MVFEILILKIIFIYVCERTQTTATFYINFKLKSEHGSVVISWGEKSFVSI